MVPSYKFPDEEAQVGNTSAKALAGKDADLDFRNVEPTAMFRGIMNFQPPGQFSGFLRFKCLIKRRDDMGIEVVAHQANFRCIGIGFFQQPVNFLGPIYFCTAFTGMGVHPPGQWLAKHKNRTSAITHILVVLFARFPGGHRERLAYFVQQLIRFLIHTNQRTSGIIGLAVQIQNIFHSRHECRILSLGNAPLGFQMRL